MKLVTEFFDLASYFTGVNTWIALAGAALFVFLVLFRTTATELVKNLPIPKNRAAGIVNLFMILVAFVTLVTLSLAFFDARDVRSAEKQRLAEERYSSALSTRQENVRACVEAEEAKISFTQSYIQPGSVRCPGGGCFLQSGSCNRREVWVSYTAPGAYFIESYELVKGDMNHGNVGNLEVTSRDNEKRATSVRAFLWCDPADRAGAGGGWANASLRGTIRLQDETMPREEVATACRGKFPEPERPKN
jgi:hypothetical protein